jgi:hypothetical protein
MEGVNSNMVYCKNFGKCHNVPQCNNNTTKKEKNCNEDLPSWEFLKSATSHWKDEQYPRGVNTKR